MYASTGVGLNLAYALQAHHRSSLLSRLFDFLCPINKQTKKEAPIKIPSSHYRLPPPFPHHQIFHCHLLTPSGTHRSDRCHVDSFVLESKKLINISHQAQHHRLKCPCQPFPWFAPFHEKQW